MGDDHHGAPLGGQILDDLDDFLLPAPDSSALVGSSNKAGLRVHAQRAARWRALLWPPRVARV